MAIKLKKIERPNPLDRTKSKYYLVQEKSGTVELEDIAEEIAARSSLTLGDVQSVLSNLMEMIPLYISLGQTLHLDNFGTFRLTVSSDGMDTPEELTAHHVKSRKIVFLPSPKLKKSLEHLSFEVEKAQTGDGGGGDFG